jgi:hypothetical protein
VIFGLFTLVVGFMAGRTSTALLGGSLLALGLLSLWFSRRFT